MVTNTSKAATAIGTLLFMALWTPVFAQQRVEFQFGVRAGVPLTNFVESNIPAVSVLETWDRAPVVAGPTFGAVLYDRLLVQVDAMYKPVRGRSRSINPLTGSIFEFRAASFEFPVVFDYFFSQGNRRLFAGGGMVAGHVVTGTTDSHAAAGPGALETSFHGQFFMKNQLPAFVANGGVEWNSPRFVIRPEVRYTRWSRNSGSQVERNQLEVSVGFSLRR